MPQIECGCCPAKCQKWVCGTDNSAHCNSYTFKLVQSFIFSNFEYCPLVWHFSSSKSLQNIEKLQERALRFLCNDHTSSHNDLLVKSVHDAYFSAKSPLH